MVNNISFNKTQFSPIYAKAKVDKTEDNEQTQKQQESLPAYNNAYVTPFIKVNDVHYTQNEKNFMDYRDKVCDVINEYKKEYNKATWEFYTNSTPENANVINLTEKAYSNIYNDKEVYDKLLEFKENGIEDKHLQTHMNDLLQRFKPNEPQKQTEESEEAAQDVQDSELVQESSEEQKQQPVSEEEISIIFNGFKPQLNGEPVSESELFKIKRTSRDMEVRKAAYAAERSSGDAIADKMIQLIKDRNEIAKYNGFDNYYQLMLCVYGTSDAQITKLFDDLSQKTDEKYKEISDAMNQGTADEWGITKEELRPWHFGYRKQSNTNNQIDEFFPQDKHVETATKIYSQMGWNIDKMPITMDLYPRDNKAGNGSCFCIDPGKDSRILANLGDGKSSMETLLHETGHAVYELGLPTSLPYQDREIASNVLTEAVAMLMETLPQREGAYEEAVGMPKEMSDNLESERIKKSVSFIRQQIFMADFEKKLYENPEQDPKKLWYDLKQHYLGSNPPDELNNEWATIPHYLTNPGYIQNYVRAEVMVSQLYEAAHEKVGDLTKSTETAKFFQENIFNCGRSKSEEEIIKLATGKELSAEAYCKQLEKLNA